MKQILLNACAAVLRRCSPDTRMNFCLEQVRSQLASSQAQGDWHSSLTLRKRLYRRFIRSWPSFSSGEVLRFHGFFNVLSTLRDVPGDLVECGVGRGRTLAILYAANAFFGLGRKVYGFDSFEGFPDAAAEDVGTRVGSPGPIPGWDDTDPEVSSTPSGVTPTARRSPRFMDREFLNPSSCAGFFRDSLAEHLPPRIAFLHLDADLYESTRDVLTHCLPRLSPGAVIVFDELHETDRWPGSGKPSESSASHGDSRRTGSPSSRGSRFVSPSPDRA